MSGPPSSELADCTRSVGCDNSKKASCIAAFRLGSNAVSSRPIIHSVVQFIQHNHRFPCSSRMKSLTELISPVSFPRSPIESHETMPLTITFQPRRVLPLQTLHQLCDELEMAEIAIGPERRLHVESVEELGEPVRGIERDEAVLRPTRGVSGATLVSRAKHAAEEGVHVVSGDAETPLIRHWL